MTLAEAVRAAGVVGAGGAGFPTHIKVSSRVDTVIANGAECEPVLATDQWVMGCHAAEILEALQIVADAVGASRVVLAVKHKYQEVLRRFRAFLRGNKRVEIFELGDFYPSGDEQVLVYEVTGRIVPEAGIPLHVGVLVQNVSTLLNISKALKGQPVILKHITVAGEVARPGVYIARVGTPLSEVLAHAGGPTIKDFSVIEGGPLMGSLVLDLESPVTKTTSGYIVLPKDHPLITRRQPSLQAEERLAMAVCCGCRMCTDLCPRYLLGHRIEPHKAMRAVQARTEDCVYVLAMGYLCCLCGVCEAYACPMGLSPRRVFMGFKERLAKEKVANPYRQRPEAAREAREWSRVPKGKLAERLQVARYLLPEVGEPQRLPEPREVRIPLRQHIGAAAVATVKPGDKVREGDCIGEIAEGAVGARVHASIAGVVKSVDPGGFIRIAK